ncbi:hypothetical protein [Psychrobacter arcticus]|nr:hypothetical protein [Psychrobacter arcticus]
MLAELPSAVIAEIEPAAELLVKHDGAKLIEIDSYPTPNTLVDSK